MKNIKDIVFEALKKVTDNVSDVYPKEWAEDVTIQLTEEDNSVYEYSSGADGVCQEEKAQVRFRIDIWHRKSTSAAAVLVDGEMAAIGLKRTGCSDVPDPSGMKHKQMRYEGIIDIFSDYVYW